MNERVVEFGICCVKDRDENFIRDETMINYLMSKGGINNSKLHGTSYGDIYYIGEYSNIECMAMGYFKKNILMH